MHQYGVSLETIRWVQGAVEKSGTHGKPKLPPLLKASKYRGQRKRSFAR